jgi:hypothetical protein
MSEVRLYDIQRNSDIALQGHLAHKKLYPPKDPRRTSGIGLLLGLRRRRFLMREVAMYGGPEGVLFVSEVPL